jgi:hypothetical protein
MAISLGIFDSYFREQSVLQFGTAPPSLFR